MSGACELPSRRSEPSTATERTIVDRIAADRTLATGLCRRARVAAAVLALVAAAVLALPVTAARAADRTAPTAPANLTATAGDATVALSWDPSTDNVGIVAYRIWRRTRTGSWPPKSFATVSAPAHAYTNSGLTDGVTYTYRVKAFDAAANASPFSNEASATPQAATAPAVPDTTPPSAPGAVSATAGDATVALRWSASSDNVGVAGYKVWRQAADGTWPVMPNASVAAAAVSWSDSGLTDGKAYTYRLTAFDLAGNQSSASGAVSATPVASACPLFGSYAPGSWPGACWRPYAAPTPFNRPVPATPRLYSDPTHGTDSARIVARLVSWGAAQNLIAGQTGTSDWWHPLYFSHSSDPAYAIHCTQWTSSCALEGRVVRIPVGARPAGGGDGHLAVIDQDTGVEYDLWQSDVPSGSGGTLNVSHGGLTRIDGDGLDSNATAAHFGLAAGIIRGADMQAGVIPHALFAQIKCSGGYAVYPAAPGTTAAPCTTFGLSNQDAPPLGARLWLDLAGSQIDALAVPAWKKPILKAMHDYGIVVGDTDGGHAGWGLQAESEQAYASFGQSSYWRTLGQQSGLSQYGGGYIFDIDSGVDWSTHLHVVDPCVSQGTC